MERPWEATMREQRARREEFSAWLRESIESSRRAPSVTRAAPRAAQPMRTLTESERAALWNEGAGRARRFASDVAQLCEASGVPDLAASLIAEPGMTLERARVRVWAASNGRGEAIDFASLDLAELQRWDQTRGGRVVKALEHMAGQA